MASRTQAVEVVDAIGLLSLALERWRSSFARKYGLVENDAIVLSHLNRMGGRMLPREIAEVMELRTGTVTAMLDRLERVGFIERMPNPTDRRSTFVDLTARGREVIDAHLTPFDTRVRREVPQQSHAEVAGYLRQLADIVQGATDDTESH